MGTALETAVELAKIRGTIYNLLSQCFFEAHEPFVKRLMDETIIRFLKTASELFGERSSRAERALSLIEKSVEHFQGFSAEEIKRELNIEYNRLFVGPGHLPAPPYESVYLTKSEENKDGVVMGLSTLDVKKHYLSAGVTLDENFTDLPDHIAVELEFMSLLCMEEHSKMEQGDISGAEEMNKKQRDFIDNHLLNWISLFTEAVCNSTKSNYFKGLAQLLEIWIHSDKELIESGIFS